MGTGSRGSCKLCSSPYAPAINSLIEKGKHNTEILKTIQGINAAVQWTYPTFRLHRMHITAPIVTAVERARANPVVVPKTNIAALEAIRDIAMVHALEHPEEVTIDHGLKAMGHLEANKRPVENWIVILAKRMVEIHSDPEIEIETPYTEIDVTPKEVLVG